MAEGLSWGDIRMVELVAPDKRRPALVLSRTSHLRHLTQVVVAPITRTVRGIATEVPIGVESGLKEPSAAKLDQLQAVHRNRLGRFVGSLDRARKREVLDALLFALELDDLG
ncbi:MAG: type II toxin-antitoxin system PemK/MazF family toxin [Deltaproteobacteria bacterium]|nr:type II toxin-antitoxin system PemK/MazF family toxin [Deltaproteobacteria bacterium]